MFFSNHPNVHGISVGKFSPQGCKMSSLTNGIPSSSRPYAGAHNERLRDRKDAIRSKKGARRVSAIKSRLRAGLTDRICNIFPKGERGGRPTPRKDRRYAKPPAAVRDRPPSGSSPISGLISDPKETSGGSNCDISIHARIFPPGGQFAFIFGMVIRGKAIIIAILGRTPS